jgi:hypothetical protein
MKESDYGVWNAGLTITGVKVWLPIMRDPENNWFNQFFRPNQDKNYS